jgi:hypothetical protein
MSQKHNQNKENMLFAFAFTDFPKELVLEECMQHSEILFSQAEEPALDKGKIKSSSYIIEESFDKKKAGGKFNKPTTNPSIKKPLPIQPQANNWSRKTDAPEEEGAGDFFDNFKGKTDQSQVHKFLKEKKFESLLQITKEQDIHFGPSIGSNQQVNNHEESNSKILNQLHEPHFSNQHNTSGQENSHQKVEINYGKSGTNDQKSIDKFFEDFDTTQIKPFTITSIYKVNEYLSYPKEEPIWYFYHDGAKSSFGPISSQRLEEMFNHKIINENIPLRFIDLFSHKSAKKPFTYFKLSDVHKPNFVNDIELSTLFYACENIIKNAKRSRLAEPKIQQSIEGEGDIFSDFTSGKQTEKKDKFQKNMKGRPVDANIKVGKFFYLR